MTNLLAGDVALVTGAGSGIGRAIAAAMAHEGALVLLSDIDIAAGTRATNELQASGGKAEFLAADLSRPSGDTELLRAAREHGPISVFVHSASPRRYEADHILAVSDEVFRQMLEVNLHAGFALSRALARDMIDARVAGRMLFITSLHAESPRNLPHYSASKAAQTMLVKELARALGPHGIRVNAIAPGAIPGGGFAAEAAGIERLTNCTALKRLGKPEEIASMAVALLCDRFSSYVTGTTLVVDGGIGLHNWIEPPDL